MRHIQRMAVTACVSAGLLFAACGDDDDDTATTTPAAGTTGDSVAPSGDAPSTVAGGLIECSNQYDGKTVTLFSPIRDIEAERLEKAYAAFEECTGADLVHEGSAEFEAQLKVRIDGGNAPDIAVLPQPGLMTSLVRDGKLLAMPDMAAVIGENFVSGWQELGTVDGEFYGAAFGANVKSLVWYNPKQFAEKGYAIPQTWDELIALSDQIVTDGGTPWCVGIESGGATGWVITDWFEDIMLRVNGAEVYDQWVSHAIPFNDPQVLTAAEEAGKILKNEDYILGGVKSIATTTFQEGGLGILDGSCFMHRQASFYGNQFPEGTVKGPDGEADAFYLPVVNAGDPKVMLGGGELLSITSDRPEVLDSVKFLSSADYANARAVQGSWISANKGLDTNVIPDELDKQFAELLISSDVFRFDGSDMMPGEVGAGSFWKEATAWIVGGSTEDMLNNIEDSWPAG